MTESKDLFSAQKIATLARLELAPEKLEEFQEQVVKILQFFETIDSLDLTDVEPFFGAVEAVNPIREDDVKSSLDRQQVLANAPDTDGEYYRVPPVFGK